MKSTKLFHRLIRLLPVVVVASFIFVALHQSTTFAVAPPAGLTISPLRTEPNIAPGTVYSNNIKVVNTTATDMTINMNAEAFGVINEEYDYSFDPGSSLVDWVRFDPSIFTLAPDTSQIVNYKISVPIGAEPRGQYISLFATSNMQASSTGIVTSERVASLLYITVEGTVSRTGSIVSLDSPWLITGPSDWTAEIRDSGTTHFRSIYSLSVQTLFHTTLSKTTSSDLILPATIRLITGSITPPPVSGIYKLTYIIGLGDNPAKTITYYVLYVRSVDLLIVIIIVMLWLVWYLRRRHYKKVKKKTN